MKMAEMTIYHWLNLYNCKFLRDLITKIGIDKWIVILFSLCLSYDRCNRFC